MLNDQERRDLRNAINPYALAPAYASWQQPSSATLAWQPVMDVLAEAEDVTLDAAEVVEALVTASDMALMAGQGSPDHAEKTAHLVTAAVLRAVALRIVEGLA